MHYDCTTKLPKSYAPICLRCSQRQIGTKPSDVALGPHSHWPNGAQCVHSCRLVPGSRTILYNSLVGTVKDYFLITTLSCIVHVRLQIGRPRRAILNMFNIAQQPPDGLSMTPRQPIPGREPIHIGRADSIRAQSRHRIG